MATPKETAPTIITLTLPTPEGGRIPPERATATLLIQRSGLAKLYKFLYCNAGVLSRHKLFVFTPKWLHSYQQQ